jgi:hypothetical protein
MPLFIAFVTNLATFLWMEAEDIGPFPQKEDDANKIKDLFIREQLLENSPSDIRTWLKERKPKSVKVFYFISVILLLREWTNIFCFHPLVDIPGQAYTPFCKCLTSSPPAVSKLRTWLKERKPKSVKEMIELGDQYLASHLYHSGEGKIMKFGSNHADSDPSFWYN